ncbi:MAG: DUF305 domain-containing protein [Geminicoccaceae bacterium]
MLLAGGVSQCPAQEAGHDSHHPVAGAGGPAPDPSPELMAVPEMMAPGSSKGGSMSPDMARMMPAMMKNMCAMMMGEGGGNTMAGPQGAGMPVSGPIDPVTGAFEAINRRMHEGMAADASAGADRAFVAAMIAHHQGAIDMAKVILAFGSDPKIRTLAEQVIKAQEGEIAFMQQWQAEQPQP